MRRTLLFLIVVMTMVAGQTAFAQDHFRYERTPGNHSLLILESRLNDEFMPVGNEIGVFTPAGLCAGASVYEENGEEAVGLAAWGDDPDQNGINGFRNGEAFAFKVWDRDTDIEVNAVAEFDFGVQTYSRDALTFLFISAVLEGPPDLIVAEAHEFGNVIVDSEANWEMTIRNGGVDPLVVSSISTDNEVFSTDFDGEFELAAGRSTVVNVTFVPTDEDEFLGTLTIESNDPDGDVEVGLRGIGTIVRTPEIELSGVEIGFGETVIGEPASSSINIRNTGNGALTISDVAIDENAFTVDFNGEIVLDPGNAVDLTVTFDPDEEREYFGTMIVSSDDPDEGEVEVALSGIGFIPPQSNIILSDDRLDFGEVFVGDQGILDLVIGNDGDQPLVISGISSDNELFTTDFEMEEEDGPHFRFDQTDGNQSVLVLEATINGNRLEQGDEIGVFTPGGVCAGGVIIENPDEAAGLAAWSDEADVDGFNGFRAGEEMSFRLWDVSARREHVAETDILQGSPNFERDALTVLNLSVGGNQMPGQVFEATLEPGQELTVRVMFTPTEFGDEDGILSIETNDRDMPVAEVMMTGRGMEVPPVMELSAESIDFEDVATGFSSDMTLRINNEGRAELEGTLSIVGDQVFSVDRGDFAIGEGQSLDVTLTFSPDQNGEFSGVLRIESNDPGNEVHDVELVGIGRDPMPDLWIGGEFFFQNQNQNLHHFGNLTIGEESFWPLPIANEGEIDLVISEIRSDDDAFMAVMDGDVVVASGEEAEIPIRFAPDEARAFTGQMTIVSNDGEFDFSVTGNGLNVRTPDIDAAMVQDIGAVLPGGRRVGHVIGRNAGDAVLTISDVAVSGDGFELANGGAMEIEPGAGFDFSVAFTSDEIGEHSGMMIITSDDPDEGEFEITLMARVIPDGPHFRFEITADNMSVIVEAAEMNGEMLERGDEFAAFTPAGLCAGAAMVEDEFPIGIAIWGEDQNQEGIQGFRENEAITWKIWDQSAGREFETIAEYSVGDGRYVGNGFAVVSLVGRDVPVPRLEVAPAMVDFGRILVDGMASRNVSIINRGNGALMIEEIVTSGAPFSVDFDGAFQVAPDGQVDVAVSFNPEEAGEFAGELVIFSNDPVMGEYRLDLIGAATDAGPPMILIPVDRYDFGEVGAGERVDWMLSITNGGGSPLQVSAPVIEGDGFLVSPGVPFDVGIGQSRMLTVSFFPQELGDYEGNLIITSNSNNEETINQVALSGRAVEAPFHFRFRATDGNMSLLIEDATLDGEQLPIGAEVAVLTEDGLVAGANRIEEYPFGVAAWGDDANTDEIDGFVEGEAISFRIWVPDLHAEFSAEPEYSFGQGVYARDALSVLTLSSVTPEGQDHFIFTITNTNHSLLVETAILNNEPLAIGDEVAVFTSRGLCAGASILETPGDEAFGLAAWGDDRDTQIIDGFAEDERFSFRFWDASAQREFAQVTADFVEGPEAYTANGFSVLSLDCFTLPQPEIEFLSMHDFGRVPVEGEAMWNFVVRNSGNAALVISDISSSGAPFSVVFEEERVLGANQEATFEVTFSPVEARVFQGSLTIRSNDRDEAVATVSLLGTGFNPNRRPFFVDAPEMVEGEERSMIEFTLMAEDPDGDPIEFSFDRIDLPEGANFSDNGDNSATFAWMPTPLDAGTYHPVFFASDGDLEGSVEIVIEVIDVNFPPEFTDHPGRIESNEGDQIDFEVTAIDFDDDPFEMTFQLTGDQPGTMPQFSTDGQGTGRLTWDIGFEDAGEYTFIFHLLNDNEMDRDVTLEIPVEIFDTNREPIVVEAIPDTEINEDAGETVIADLNQVFLDPDGDNLEFNAVASDEFGVSVDGDGMLVVNSMENFFGEGEVVVTADDGRNAVRIAFAVGNLSNATGQASHRASRALRSTTNVLDQTPLRRDAMIEDQFMLTVLPVNDAPVWRDIPDGEISVSETDRVSFEVRAFDIEGAEVTVSFEPGNFPEGATFDFTGDGHGIFDWATGFEDAGRYSGNLVASDGDLESVFELVVIVANVNRAPEWDDFPVVFEGNEGEVIRFDVSGSDPDGDQVELSLISDQLPEAASFQDRGDGSGTFVWQPTFDDAGEYAATLRIEDASDGTDRNITIVVNHVNRSPEVSSAIDDLEIEEDSDMVLVADLNEVFSDPDGDELQFAADGDGRLGLSIDENGVLAIEPDENLNGRFDLTISATDGEMSIEDQFVLTITPLNDNPFWVNPVREISVEEGEPIEFTMTGDDIDLDFEGDELSVAMINDGGTVGRGANFEPNGESGVYTWDTDFEDEGEYSVRFRVEDQNGGFADIDVSISVEGINRPPFISQPSDQARHRVDASENEQLRIGFVADDFDGDQITFTIANAQNMQGSQFTDHRDGTATLLWTPPFDAQREPYTPVIRAADGEGGIDEITLEIVVANVNRAPVFDQPTNQDVFAVEVEENSEVRFNVHANDADNDNLQYSVVQNDLPNGFQLQNGVFTWTPGFDHARQQAYTPLLRVVDPAGATDEIRLEITVRNLNRPPVIVAPANADAHQVSVDENEELSVGFRATDADQEAIEWEVIDDGGLPQGWQFADAGDGNATFVWTPGFDDAREEPYTPVMQATDESGISDRIILEITVDNVNRAPVAQGQIQNVAIDEDAGRTVIGDMRQFFSDPDGDNLNFNVAGGPQQLGLAIEGGNLLVMTPAANFNLPAGADITVTATDGVGQANQAFRVTIRAVNDQPNAFNLVAPNEGSNLADYRATFVWNRSIDVDNDPIRYSFVFTFVDAQVDTIIRRSGFQDTTLTIDRLDTLVTQFGIGEPLIVRWWIESTDGQLIRESSTRRTVVIPPLSVPDEEGTLPTEVTLYQNYPNPFNPSTIISFGLPVEQNVSISVYDSRGRLIDEVENRSFSAGRHAVKWEVFDQPAGLYLIVLRSEGVTQSTKAMLIK